MRRRSATAAGSNSRASSRKQYNSDMLAFLRIGAAGSKKQLTAERAIWVRRQHDPKHTRGEPLSEDEPFALEEATIDQLHEAIRAGRRTCVAIVQHYIARARAFNGVCSRLVTEAGAPVPEATGAARATAPLRFPGETVKA